MQLSTRGRYAVMALLDLVTIQNERGGGKNPVKLSEIAERQDISLSYLEQLFAQLRKGGVVGSVRGPGGGYVLKKPSNKTMLSSVISSVDEAVKVTRCNNGDHRDSTKDGCMRGVQCNAHHLWVALSECITSFMEQVSIEMVLNGELNLVTTRVEKEPKEERTPRVHISG